MKDEGRAISYEALAVGTPVVTSAGTQFGQVHHVLQIPELDVFDGISVTTGHGLRFVDRDQITEITTTVVRCALTDAQAASLPPPSGPPVLQVDVAHDEGLAPREHLAHLEGPDRNPPEGPERRRVDAHLDAERAGGAGGQVQALLP